jgi:pyruvate/2-oxoglutarate dehydrogenase complex dihydrolipoamide acyltransferase (E2) component
VPARSRRPPRDLRLARLPLLLAYLLVLLGTPIGEAGFLWMHLATAHSSPVSPDAAWERPIGLRLREDGTLASTPAREPPPAPAHEHTAAHAHKHKHSTPHEHAHADAREHAAEREHAHVSSGEHAHSSEHHARIASADTEPAPQSVAPDQPHEHGGRVHTHRQHPAPDAESLLDALSKFYLAPPTMSVPSTSAGPRQARQVPLTPHQVAARIDTPPPRLPG